MSRAAIVRDGVVENIILLESDSGYETPEGCTIVKAPEGCAIGDLYKGRKFTNVAKELSVEAADLMVEKAINKRMHKMAPVGEQLGILRKQLVAIAEAQGIDLTPEFAKFNEIAVEEVNREK